MAEGASYSGVLTGVCVMAMKRFSDPQMCSVTGKRHLATGVCKVNVLL